MKIVSRYAIYYVFKASFQTLAILLGIDCIFAWMEELRILSGNYDLWASLWVVLLGLVPKSLEWLPFALMVGTILGLGQLCDRREWIIIEQAGVTPRGMLRTILWGSMLIILPVWCLSLETIPNIVRATAYFRSSQQYPEGVFTTDKGVWLKQGTHTLHIGTLDNLGWMTDLTLYTFTGEELDTVIQAKSAIPNAEEGYLLKEVVQTNFEPHNPPVSKITAQSTETLFLSNITNTMLRALGSQFVEAEGISALYQHAAFYKENALVNPIYTVLFWERIAWPWVCWLLMVLAFPFSLGTIRSSKPNVRLLYGIVLGGVVNMALRFMPSLSLATQVPVWGIWLIGLSGGYGIGWILLRRMATHRL